jgi:hypothetical protein
MRRLVAAGFALASLITSPVCLAQTGTRESPTVAVGDTITFSVGVLTSDGACFKSIPRDRSNNPRIVITKCTAGAVHVFERASRKGVAIATDSVTFAGAASTPAPVIVPTPTPTPSSTPTPSVDPLAEPAFDSTKASMIYQTDFENYTPSTIYHTCAQTPQAPTFLDGTYIYACANGPNTAAIQLVPGMNGGQAMAILYKGIDNPQEAPDIFFYGSAGNGSNATPPTSTSVYQYWVNYSAGDPAHPISDTTIFQIKSMMLWHFDPANSRIQFNLVTNPGGCAVKQAPPPTGYLGTFWGVYDQNYTGCNANQPVGPYFYQLANSGTWHRLTYLVKANTTSTSRDGRALMWIDGTLIVRIEQSAVGVVPVGGGQQPWCVQGDVDNLIVGYGVGGPEWGGPLSNGSTAVTIKIDNFKWWKLPN